MNRRNFFKNFLSGMAAIFGSVASIKAQQLEDKEDVECSLKTIKEPTTSFDDFREDLGLTLSNTCSTWTVITYYSDPEEAFYDWSGGEPV